MSCNREQFVDDTTLDLPGVRKVKIVSGSITTGGSKTSPTIANVTATLAATEYSYVLPASTVGFRMHARGKAKLKLAFISGNSGTTFYTISKGFTYSEDNISDTASITLYFQSDTAGEIVEILSWQS